MGSASTDGARVRFHGTKLKTATGEDPLVGLEHVFVFPLAVLHIRVKAIGIFHDELPAAHQTEARPHFITKFRLNLIEIERQLAVGAHRAPNEIGDYFLVGRAQAKIALVTVFEAHQFFTVDLPTATLLPQLGRRGDGQ